MLTRADTVHTAGIDGLDLPEFMKGRRQSQEVSPNRYLEQLFPQTQCGEIGEFRATKT